MPFYFGEKYGLTYIEYGFVDILFANDREIAKLVGYDQGFEKWEMMLDLNLHHKIDNILITLGKRGMCVLQKGSIYHTPVYEVDSIVNTSGAGDTAAGVFLSGLLDHRPMQEVLAEAAYYASKVLRYYGSSLPNGR